MTGPREHHGPRHSSAMPQPDWAALAHAAAQDANAGFGRRVAGLPGTWLGAQYSRATSPSDAANTGTLAFLRGAIGKLLRYAKPLRDGSTNPAPPFPSWNYWWQAHYLDAVIDHGWQALDRGERASALEALQLGQALLRGIFVRNGGRFPNYFYDDMAWLALASGRLGNLSRRLSARTGTLAARANKSLTRQLLSARDEVLGGGIYWSRKRDFKNTPANGPAAVQLARSGHSEQARELLDWLRNRLYNPATGLYLDGLRLPGPTLESAVYSYNQGTVLGALLALGDTEDLVQAAALIDDIRTHLTLPDGSLQLQPGGGDGSLFTGILCRYLALAAQEAGLPARSRDAASSMVSCTAAVLAGTAPVELSGAIQRWMTLSAAASLP